MTNLPVRPIIRVALIIAGVAVAYFVVGRLLLVLGAPPNGAVTTVWLPSGISVAALVLFGPFAAIGSFLGSVTLELKNGVPLSAGFIVGLANAVSELLCYFLIVRGGRTFSIETWRDVLRFVMAALLGALFSAVAGVSSYVLFAVVPASLFWPNWLTWFGSTAIGIVLITPFLVYSVRERLAMGSRARYLEYAAALIVLASAAFLWQEPAFSNHSDDPVILVVILVLLWIAFRFPSAAMTLAVFSFTIAAVGGAVYHLSQAPPESEFAPVFVLQLMLGGLAMIGYLIDSIVTDQKRATVELLESEERFRKAFQHSAIGMALVGLDGRWLKVNNALCKIVGYSEEELLGKTFQEITHPDDLQADMNFVARLLAGEIDHYQMEKRYFHKDGHVLWIRLSVSLIRSVQGNPLHLVSQIEDVTEGKLAEKILRSSNQRFEAVLQAVPDLMFEVDSNGRYLNVWGIRGDFLAAPENQLRGRTVEEMLPAAAAQETLAAIAEADETNHSFGRQIKLPLPQGDFWFELSVAKQPSEPTQESSFIVLSRDITERKRAEDEIRKLNDELETKVRERTQQLLAAQEELVRKEKLAILGQLSGSVGHELRNPLGVMNNAVYFLKMVLTGADETTKEYLDIIKKEIDNSLRIITDLLDFARTRSPQRQPVAPGDLVRQNLEKCTFPENVAVTVDIPEAVPNLNVDPAQLGQVLQNLITNAVQAMPGGGALLIAARLVGAGLVPADEQEGVPLQECVEISVSDSGEGITPENMKKLFQPLFTTKAKGIGLGLVVCKNLVEANGGQMTVESEPGKRTTFTVMLPIEERT